MDVMKPIERVTDDDIAAATAVHDDAKAEVDKLNVARAAIKSRRAAILDNATAAERAIEALNVRRPELLLQLRDGDRGASDELRRVGDEVASLQRLAADFREAAALFDAEIAGVARTIQEAVRAVHIAAYHIQRLRHRREAQSLRAAFVDLESQIASFDRIGRALETAHQETFGTVIADGHATPAGRFARFLAMWALDHCPPEHAGIFRYQGFRFPDHACVLEIDAPTVA